MDPVRRALRLEALESRTNPFAATLPAGGDPSNLVVTDFNGDGLADIASVGGCGCTDDPNLYIYLGLGGGNFGLVNGQPLDHIGFGLVTADFDLDGKADLAALDDSTEGGYYVLLGNGDGTFRDGPTPTAPLDTDYYQSLFASAVGEVNGDGVPDLIASGTTRDFGDCGCVEPRGVVIVLLGNGDGSFSPGPTASPGYDAYRLVVADLNGDGFDDLATIDRFDFRTDDSYGSVNVLLNNRMGGFTTSNVPGFQQPYALAVADMTGDGALDLLVGQAADDSLVVLVNDGTGHFPTRQTVPDVGYGTVSLATADFNGDGRTDVALGQAASCGCEESGIVILLNQGGGNYTPGDFPGPVSIAGVPYSLVAADLDGDGRPDLAATYYGYSEYGEPVAGIALFQNLNTFVADVSVTATGPSTVAPGGTVTYTVTVTNTGPQVANLLRVAVPVPTGVTGLSFTSTAAGGATGNTAGTGAVLDTLTLPVGASVTYTVTGTAIAQAGITLTLTATGTLPSGITDPTPGDLTASVTTTVTSVFPPPPPPASVPRLAVGAGAFGHVKVYDAAGAQVFSFLPYVGFVGGVVVATGDVTGDGVEDIVTGTASGSSHVKVFDGATGAEIASFLAFDGFAGGVTVAVVGGRVAVGAGPGAQPHVKVFTPTGVEAASFLAFAPGFVGGVAVGGAGGLLVVGSGVGAAPHVVTFDAATLAPVASFLVFDPRFTGGINVGGGVFAGQEVVTVGTASVPALAVSDARSGALLSAQAVALPFGTGGVRSATDAGSVVVGAGPGAPSRVRLETPDLSVVVREFDAFAGFFGGVFVG
jgi:uncharacterized repeat protein (TIGR01451 family)